MTPPGISQRLVHLALPPFTSLNLRHPVIQWLKNPDDRLDALDVLAVLDGRVELQLPSLPWEHASLDKRLVSDGMPVMSGEPLARISLRRLAPPRLEEQGAPFEYDGVFAEQPDDHRFSRTGLSDPMQAGLVEDDRRPRRVMPVVVMSTIKPLAVTGAVILAVILVFGLAMLYYSLYGGIWPTMMAGMALSAVPVPSSLAKRF